MTRNRVSRPELARTRRGRKGQTVRHHGRAAGRSVAVSWVAQRRQKRRPGGLGVPQTGQGGPVISSSAGTGRTV
ncbi:hypothetical protein, partial [Streptomyces acidiscabies]